MRETTTRLIAKLSGLSFQAAVSYTDSGVNMDVENEGKYVREYVLEHPRDTLPIFAMQDSHAQYTRLSNPDLIHASRQLPLYW